MLDLKKIQKNKNESEKLLKKVKKHPKENLENYSKIFAQLGLVLALLLVYVIIQDKSYEKNGITLNYDVNRVIEEAPAIVEYKIKVKPIPKKKVILKSLKKIDDDIPQEETFIDKVDPDAPLKEPSFTTVDIDEEPEPDGIPFLLIEDVPVFPGCVGTNEELKACFEMNIAKFINKKFDASLAESLGLSAGKQRIFTVFKIDKNGNVVDILARAPHKRLQEEAIRVINLLPKMEPGMQRKKPVVVNYSLPITFRIE